MRHSRFALALALTFGSAAALAQPAASRKWRVAVMDLSESALKMQQATSGLGGGVPGVQTTTTFALPAPAECVRGLTKMLGTVLVKTGRFTVLGRAAMTVKALTAGMPKIAWTDRVIDVRDGAMYVNATAADGMKPGLELPVFEMQPALVDPETGKSLGAPERQVGTIVIDQALEKFSTAKSTVGERIARGHVRRFSAP